MSDNSFPSGVFGDFLPILVAFGQSRGLSIDDMSKVAGLRPLDIVDPSARHPDESAALLWAMIAESDCDGALQLSLAEAAPMSIYGGLAEGARYADTLGVALERIARHRGIIAYRLELSIQHSDDQVAVSVTHTLDDVDQAHLSSVGVFLLKRLITDVLDVKDAIRYARLKLPEPDAATKITDFFQCDIFFGDGANEICLCPDAYDRPINHANTELFSFVERHFLRTRLSLEHPTWPLPLLNLRRAIVENALKGDYAPSSAARSANLGLRSAQRLASSQGYTLQRMIDEIRFENAKALLRDPKLTIGAIAEALSFSDDRSFRRAFSRVIGLSPTEYRLGRTRTITD